MNTQEIIDFRNTEGSDLIRISDTFIVRLSDITNIEVVDEHPETHKTDNTYPKIKVSLKDSAWKWCLITVENYNKYLKPLVLDISELDN